MKLCGKQVKIEGRFVRVARLDADKYYFLDDPEPMLRAVRRCGTRVDLFTFVQRVPESKPNYPYPMEWDNFAVLPITSFEDWWNTRIGFKARNKAKQAEKKGVFVREVQFDEDLVRGMWEIYNETPVRQGRRFPHYGKDLDTVRREEATYLESSQFIGAYFENRLIGFVKLVMDETRTQAGLMNIVSMVRHRDKAPANALVAQAVKSCASRGLSYLVYSNFAYGRKQRDGLSDFKQRNAFERVNVPRYYIPLTWLGAATYRLGLHHRLLDYIPEELAVKLREMRSAWYRRRFHTAS